MSNFSGYGGADDGHTYKLNGTSVYSWCYATSYTFSLTLPSINIGDVLDIYNCDYNSGSCWSAGNFHFTITYNSQTWNIGWQSDYSYCVSTPSCVITPPYNPSEYPAHLVSYRLDATGPVRIDSGRFDCDLVSSSSSSYMENWSSSSLSGSFSSESTDSTSSSISSSQSSSSGIFPQVGTTYYSEFKSVNDINNPLMNDNVQMQYLGHFDTAWDKTELDFDNFGYGIKKTSGNQGAIYCNDASKLFSIQGGYLGMTLSLPYAITNGVYAPLLNNTADLNEYILWGVNIGQYEYSQPGLYAALTPRGIEFTIYTSAGVHTLIDATSNIAANVDTFYEFVWDTNLDDYLMTTAMVINGQYVATGNPPIADDDITDLNFYVLNTPFQYSNYECTIKKLIIDNRIPDDIIYDVQSSSSSSL